MRKIKIGCGGWGFRELPIEEHFRISRQFGFNILEFGIGLDREGWLPAEPEDDYIEWFSSLKAKYSTEVPFMCIENDFTVGDERKHQEGVKEVIRQMHSIYRFGATYVRLFAGFTPAQEVDEVIWKRMISAFEECEHTADKLNQVIAIETHGRITFERDIAHHTPTVSTDPDCVKRLLGTAEGNWHL